MNHYLAHILCYYEYLGEDSNRRSRTYKTTVAVRFGNEPTTCQGGMGLRHGRVLSRRGKWWLDYTRAIKRG